jgi:hypothetical protein
LPLFLLVGQTLLEPLSMRSALVVLILQILFEILGLAIGFDCPDHILHLEDVAVPIDVLEVVIYSFLGLHFFIK